MAASPPICRNSILNSLPRTEVDGTRHLLTPAELIATEQKIADLWNAGELPYLTHLEGSLDGSFEHFLCNLFAFDVKPTDWVLASHRCHFVYQLHGGTDLIEQVQRGRSMFLYGPRFLCSAIVAGTASIAVGLALAIQRRGGSERVFCFGGDACAEHGHWMEAVHYSWTKDLPLAWVVTDNDSSCGVTKEQRRGSRRALQWPGHVIRFSYAPKYPHAGSGVPMTLKPKTMR